jgi:hypothetical protein
VAGTGNTVSSDNSFIGAGENNNLYTGSTDSSITGGDTNHISAARSFIGGGYSNTIAGSCTYSCIAGGIANGIDTSANNAYIGGGANNLVSASSGTISGGSNNTVLTNYATVSGGQNNKADGLYSIVTGGIYGWNRGITAASHMSSGKFITLGDAQYGKYHQMISTTNNTPTVLTASANVVSIASTIVLPNSSTYTFIAYVSARESANSYAATFELKGCIRRRVNASDTAIIGTPILTNLGRDASASAWTVGAQANTTNGTLEIVVTGAASTNIKWSALITTVEVVG